MDIVLYHQRQTPIACARTTPFLSLVTDLCVGNEAIVNDFGKDCRYKVRRAETKDGLQAEFFLDPESRLEEFGGFYDAFAKEKALPPCDRQWLAAAARARQLALTSASRNGEVLIWHAYVMAGKTARLQYSASRFRDRDNDYRALIGRANRWLHWKEMLRFREMGLERYDWGGLFENESTPERAGVNQFKRDFGGRPQRTYICTVPVTLRGRLYLPLREAWRHLNRAWPARQPARA